MPDSPAPPDDMPTRVAVLEEIARNTSVALSEIRADVRELRTESRRDGRWLLGVILGAWTSLLGVMAHGFHWL